MENNSRKLRLIISAALIFSIILIISIFINYFINARYEVRVEVSPRESFKITVDGEESSLNGSKTYQLKAGETTIKLNKGGYDEFIGKFNINRNNKNIIRVDMSKNKKELNGLRDIDKLSNNFINNYGIVETIYLDDSGYWAIINIENKKNTDAAILVAKRVNNRWVLEIDPIKNIGTLNNSNNELPQSIKDSILTQAIEFLGEQEFSEGETP